MTTTELYSGIGGKSSSRVLRPPGGGSSNIFGGGEEPNPNARQQAPPAQEQSPAAQRAPQQQQQPPAQQQQDAQGGKFKNRGNLGADPAPYASFAESGKKSVPTQFDDCSTESQNDADFRCYSVTAYREQMATNAAVRERARGSAQGATNPITHEDVGQSPPNPYQTYEQTKVHPQQVPMERTYGRKGQSGNQRRGKFNPITGEEYPDTYGQA